MWDRLLGAGRELRRLSSDWGESLFQVRVQSRGGQISLIVKDMHCGPSGREKDMEGESLRSDRDVWGQGEENIRNDCLGPMLGDAMGSVAWAGGDEVGPAQGQSCHDRDPQWRQWLPSSPALSSPVMSRADRSRMEAHTRAFPPRWPLRLWKSTRSLRKREGSKAQRG